MLGIILLLIFQGLLLIALISITTILVHEMGHYLAARLVGVEVLGACSLFWPEDREGDIWLGIEMFHDQTALVAVVCEQSSCGARGMAIGGPVANLIVAMLAFALLVFTPGLKSTVTGDIVLLSGFINLVMMAINLLPFEGSDGQLFWHGMRNE